MDGKISPLRKHPKALLSHEGKSLINDNGWNSKLNWLTVLLAALPLLFSRVTEDPVLPIRYIFLGAFIFLYIFYFYILRKPNEKFYFSYPLKAVFALAAGYTAWSILCVFYAINIPTAIYEVARQIQNFTILFLIMAAVKKELTGVFKLFKVLTIAAIFHGLIGIIQYYKNDLLNLPGTDAPYGLMVHRNLFGSAQALLLPFVLYVMYKAQGKWLYISYSALIAVILSGVISNTRSAWLAIICILFFTLTLMIIFFPANRKKWIFSTCIGIVVIFGLLLVLNRQTSSFQAIKEKALTLIFPSINNASSTGRLLLWSKSANLIKDHPAFGTGPGNWNLAIWDYGSIGTNWDYGEKVPSRPHNVYLQVASETGIPGAILFFGIWVLLWFIGFSAILKSSTEDNRAIFITMLAGLLGFAIDGMFSFPLERIEHSLYFMTMAGIILGTYANLPIKEREGQHLHGRRIFTFIVIIIGFNVFLGYHKYNFEKHMNLAKMYRKEHELDQVISEVEEGKSRFVTIDLNGDPLELHSSIAYVGLTNYNKALEEILIGKSYNPNSARIWTTMGAVYANLEQYDNAIECYNRALQLTPYYDVALKNLARIYFILGNYDLCIKMIARVSINNKFSLKELLDEAKRRLNQKR